MLSANHGPRWEPHRLAAAELFPRLASRPEGLARPEAAERLLLEGPNVLAGDVGPSAIRRAAAHVLHPFALLLGAGAGLAAAGERFLPGQGMAFIAAALVLVVLVNAGFGFWQERRVERAMAAFRGMLAPRARVVREGTESEVDAAEVVPGDVVALRGGDRVPADARLFEARALKVDNSALTGECEPQLRSLAPADVPLMDSRNVVFMGTHVTTGEGRALVFATGNGTAIGRIARVTRDTARVETPIHRELRRFVRVLSVLAVAFGALFFGAGWAIGNPFWTNLVFAIGIIVANVPEGLLPTVTLALAAAGRRMAARGALLKSLECAETLGCTTVVCTDKTGTLTLNEMRVAHLLAPDPGDALRVMVLCNNATVAGTGSAARASGDPTETALLLHAEAERAGVVADLRAAHPRLHERPFDSATREMAVAHRVPGGIEVLLKGAPEVVVAQCAATPSPAGPPADVLAAADRLARRGERVLALARKVVPESADLEAEAASGGYRFAGLVALHDPPRPEVPAAIARCLAAGIRVIVVSGDHPRTVAAIAREVGVVRGEAPLVVTGAELATWSGPALRRALAGGEVLFARTAPLDKLRIVEALQATGHIVAVTGDGVNDAPALKRADIGVAMGRSGTDVAREAAGVVLLDDNFATIVAAVEEGRVIYANIRRFVGYVLTSNVPEMIPYVAFVLFDIPLPLPVLLVLAIDLGTDMAPAIGLAAETAETDVMRLPPRPRSERLLSPRLLLAAYAGWGLVETAAGFAAYLWVLFAGGWSPGTTLGTGDPLYRRSVAAFFAAVVLCQVANVFVWRTTRESVLVKGLLRNRAVLAGIAVELGLLLFVVQTPAGHSVFGTASLPAAAWLVPIPFALAMFGLSEILKRAARRREAARQARRPAPARAA